MTENEYVSVVLAIANASLMTTSSIPTTSNKARVPTPLVQKLVQMAGKEVLGLIAAVDHPRRIALITSASNIASGNLLPQHFGPISGVQLTIDDTHYRPGVLMAPAIVLSYIDDAAVINLEVPVYWFAVDGERIYHTGQKASFDYVPLAVSSDVSTVPVEFEQAVIALALANLFGFEGDDSTAMIAGHFANLAKESKALIAGNTGVPVVRPYAA